MDPELKDHLRAYIAIAEACWRKENPSYSWHVLDWMSYRRSIRWPLIWRGGGVINLTNVT